MEQAGASDPNETNCEGDNSSLVVARNLVFIKACERSEPVWRFRRSDLARALTSRLASKSRPTAARGLCGRCLTFLKEMRCTASRQSSAPSEMSEVSQKILILGGLAL